jgi:hypothetical protein
MVLTTIVTGAYKPTYNWGASLYKWVIVHDYIGTMFGNLGLCWRFLEAMLGHLEAMLVYWRVNGVSRIPSS